MDINKERFGTCELCGRDAYDITEHHLIPRTTHRLKRVKTKHTREEQCYTIDVCQPCHKAVHTFWKEKELADDFNTIEAILADERMKKHVEWARKQRPDLRMKG